MEIEPLELRGAFMLRPRVIEDVRGRLVKPFSASFFRNNDLRADFVEQYYSYSEPGVIRGMHFQISPYQHSKLVYVVSGAVKDIMLDMRCGPAYGRFISVTLSASRGDVLYIPEGVAHGFETGKDPALLVYNVTSEYQREYDYGIRWDSFGFQWSTSNPIISARDREFPVFGEVPYFF